MSEIIPNKLYLGSLDDAINEQWLQMHNIKCIISVFHEPMEYMEQIKGLATKANILHHIVPVPDVWDVQILDHMDYLYNVMETNEVVLIHCIFGISRSPTIAISYLMLKYKIYLDQATKIILKERHFIFPNDGFIKQLIALEYKIFGMMTYLPNSEGIRTYKRLLHGL
jgi:predicted protein tyrosine phosphatase